MDSAISSFQLLIFTEAKNYENVIKIYKQKKETTLLATKEIKDIMRRERDRTLLNKD